MQRIRFFTRRLHDMRRFGLRFFPLLLPQRLQLICLCAHHPGLIHLLTHDLPARREIRAHFVPEQDLAGRGEQQRGYGDQQHVAQTDPQ